MKKFYADPSMDINVFDAEDIVTVSAGGTAVDPTDLAGDTTVATGTVNWSDLGITF